METSLLPVPRLYAGEGEHKERADREGWQGRGGEKEQLLAVPRLKREWQGKRTDAGDEKEGEGNILDYMNQRTEQQKIIQKDCLFRL